MPKMQLLLPATNFLASSVRDVWPALIYATFSPTRMLVVLDVSILALSRNGRSDKDGGG